MDNSYRYKKWCSLRMNCAICVAPITFKGRTLYQNYSFLSTEIVELFLYIGYKNKQHWLRSKTLLELQAYRGQYSPR